MPTPIHWIPERISRGVDNHVGARVFQLTSAPAISYNIYNEQLYASVDGSRIAFARCSAYDHADLYPFEVWVCDLNTGCTARLDNSPRVAVASNPFQDTVYYVSQAPGGVPRVTRLDLKTLKREDLFAFEKCPLPTAGTATISPDGRYFVSGLRVKGDIYGLYRIDLQRGSWEVFHEHKDILNPHMQFEPSEGKDILVQLNRGGFLDDDDNIIRLVGDEGATLYVINSDGGDYRPLPVGKPHTAPVTGHECWVGRSGRILLTTDDSPNNGALHTVAPGDKRAKPLAKGLSLMHVSATADGRFFVSDDVGTGRLYAGSFATGRVLPVCESHASGGMPQFTHAHPYITPDNRRVIFNSDRTGIGQVFAAVLPEGFLEALDG